MNKNNCLSVQHGPGFYNSIQKIRLDTSNDRFPPVRLDATATTTNIPGRLVYSAEDDTESQTFGGPFRSNSQGEMIIDETKLEKYIDNTMQGGGALVLPERIKGVSLNVVSDSRVGSIGTSKYTTKH